MNFLSTWWSKTSVKDCMYDQIAKLNQYLMIVLCCSCNWHPMSASTGLIIIRELRHREFKKHPFLNLILRIIYCYGKIFAKYPPNIHGYFLGGVICRFRLFDANRPTFLNRPTSNKSSIQFLNSHDLDMRLFFWIRFLRIWRVMIWRTIWRIRFLRIWHVESGVCRLRVF